MSGKRIFPEALLSLRQRLSSLPSRSKERRSIMQETANLYGVSEATLYRALNVHNRPFRTVKEMHETLYHFHEPQNEVEANQWLFNYLIRYNNMDHRSEAHSRMEDWQLNLPATGIREMCSWDRFCTFAHEPERRRVVWMPVSALTVFPMKSIQTWPGKPSCCGGAFLTANCMLNSRTSVMGLILRPGHRKGF